MTTLLQKKRTFSLHFRFNNNMRFVTYVHIDKLWLNVFSEVKTNMATTADDTSVQAVGNILTDKSQPLKDRFRALFTLRNLGGEKAIDYISKCFDDTSALLKHELAYCLGQMQDKYALDTLSRVLSDCSQEPMVRHEAGNTPHET